MCAQVSGQCVAASTGVAAEGALEGFLPCVQLDVSKEVSLLSEWHPALAALERPVAYKAQEVTVDQALLRSQHKQEWGTLDDVCIALKKYPTLHSQIQGWFI